MISRAVSSASRAQKSADFKMGLSDRFVAIGCWRTKVLVLAIMQHMYCDHGLSVVVLSRTWPIFLSLNSTESGGPAIKASNFPSINCCVVYSGSTSQLI